jgi:phosphoglycolate phosphatase-like HAD superfamily hydrolase
MGRRKRRFILDMDGVFVNFHKGIADLHNLPNTWNAIGARCVTEALGVPKPWYDKCDAAFWRDLPKMPDADAIINLVEEFFEPEDIFLCTAFEDATPPEWIGQCIAGKIMWLERHYPDMRQRLLYTNAKHGCAFDDAVMIDDSDTNIIAFRKAGGCGVLVPRLWNSHHHLADRTFQVVAGELGRLMED